MLNPVIISQRKSDGSSEEGVEIRSSTSTQKNEIAAQDDDGIADIPEESSRSPPSDIITQTDRNGKPIARDAIKRDDRDRQSISLLYRICCWWCIPSGRTVMNNGSTTRPNTPQVIHRSISGEMCLMLPQKGELVGRKCLVLDLDETLVHSSFQRVANADYVIPVTIDDNVHKVYVLKRPGVDEFMRRMGAIYEIVVYTASLSKYADPLLDKLDIHKVITKRLFRESCVYYDGHYVKDLSLLNRDISQVIIVDNSPMSYTFHPENAIDCGTYIDDTRDIEMWQIADFLEGIRDCSDVRDYCRSWRQWCRHHPTSAPQNVR